MNDLFTGYSVVSLTCHSFIFANKSKPIIILLSLQLLQINLTSFGENQFSYIIIIVIFIWSNY